MAEMLVQSENLASIADAIRSKGNTAEALRFPDGFISAIADITTGVELNFVVVGGTSEPTNPEENTIWVNTPDKITGYAFSPTEPAEPVEGLVWILTGTSNTVAFNALKKGCIQVCPLSDKQYVGGAWVDKEAKSYQNGEWVEWFDYLYSYGNEFESLTGGWATQLKVHNPTANTESGTLSAVKDDNGIVTFTNSHLRGGIYYCRNKINLSSVKTIIFKGTITCKYATWAGFYVWPSLDSYYIRSDMAAYYEPAAGITGDFTLDVQSLTGEYYIGFGIYSSNESIVMESLHFE